MRLISHYQAAAILKLSPPTVYSLTARGILKLYPAGKGKFLDEGEVRKYGKEKQK